MQTERQTELLCNGLVLNISWKKNAQK